MRILSFSPATSQMTTDRRLLRVCKSWRASLEAMPQLWRHLDFSGARKPISLRGIRSSIERSKGQLSQLTLSKVGVQLRGPDVLGLVFAKCKNLEKLHLKDGDCYPETLRTLLPSAKHLKSLHVGPAVYLDYVMEFLENSPSLAYVEFESVTAGPSSGEYFNKDQAMLNLRVLVLQGSDRLISGPTHFLNFVSFPHESSTLPQAQSLTDRVPNGWNCRKLND